MSVDSLLCEVTPNLGLRPYIQAADQLYYKDQRVLSDVKAETSGAGQQQQAQGNKGNKGGNKNNEGGRNRQDSRSSKGGDKVRQAINEAKQTAQQARGGRNRRSSNKSESGDLTAVRKELEELREDNASLRKEVDELRQMVLKNCNISQPCGGQKAAEKKETAAPEPKKEAAAADDDFDLFGSDDEDDEEKQRITEERLKAYAEKKAKKPGPIAKSNIIYDVKPWDDTIKIEDIEKAVRGIEMDGLVWGASKKVPVAFGLNKLQIMCVVEDDKVSSDTLEERICEFEDLVQSVDIVAFNKV